MSPSRKQPLPLLIRAEIAFINEVFPAPDEPIIYRVYPGRAYPEIFFSTTNGFVLPNPLFLSSVEVGTVTV